MSLKLLIDECLSPELVDMAYAAGHYEATCVRNRGWLGVKDPELVRRVLDEDFVLVTHNARDFRGPGEGAPGGLYARVEFHAGLVCLNSSFRMDLPRPRDLFEIALAELKGIGDLTNIALEVFEHDDGSVSVVRYTIPT